MIRAVIVMNTQGKPRLLKFYEHQPPEKQQELVRSVYGVLCGRPENASNFVQVDALFGPDTRLVYKHLATMYFVFVFDSSENELAMLDLIQVFVETLDRCFKNVCELDIVFNFNKMHTILDEMILGGQVLETSSEEVMRAVDEIEAGEVKCKQFHPQVHVRKVQPLALWEHRAYGLMLHYEVHVLSLGLTTYSHQTCSSPLADIVKVTG